MTPERSLAGLMTLAGTACLFAAGVAAAPVASLIREQKMVVVDGVKESWRLEWEAPPVSTCGAEDVDTAMSCPCSGFAYGEAGALSLVRLRPGASEERLALAPYFRDHGIPGAAGAAVLQRWRPIPATVHSEDDDWRHATDWNFLQRVRARPSAEVMRTADYNHDGRASEFLMQVGTRPCGRQAMVLVGVSRFNPRLHVFASAEAPNVPLELAPRTWEAVRRSDKPVHVIEWPCGDQAGDVESMATVAVRRGIFHVQREDRPCAKEEPEGAP
jgi:hypothetical protein